MARWFRPAELEAGGAVVDYARRCLQSADPATWADALDAIAAYDRTAEVGSLTVPVRLIAAEFDAVSTPDAMADLSRRLQQADLRVLAGAAHMSPFLDPGRLAELILAARPL